MNSIGTSAVNIDSLDPHHCFLQEYVSGVLGIQFMRQQEVENSVDESTIIKENIVVAESLSSDDKQMLQKILQAMGWESNTRVLYKIPDGFSGRVLNLCTEILAEQLEHNGDAVVAHVGTLSQMKSDPQFKRQSWNLMKRLSAYTF